MEKTKNVPASAASGSSRSAGRKAIKNLKNLNAQLLNELVERRKEIEQLRSQLAAATAELNVMEMRLLAAVREENAVERKLERILQQQRDLSLGFSKKDSEKKSSKKWIYPIAAAATLCAVVGLCGWAAKA